MSKVEIKTRMVPERYIVLPYPERVWHTAYGKEPDPPGEVEITVRRLCELFEHTEMYDRFFDSAYIDFSTKQERALEAAGWATGATRGGVWATDAFKVWMRENGLY